MSDLLDTEIDLPQDELTEPFENSVDFSNDSLSDIINTQNDFDVLCRMLEKTYGKFPKNNYVEVAKTLTAKDAKQKCLLYIFAGLIETSDREVIKYFSVALSNDKILFADIAYKILHQDYLFNQAKDNIDKLENFFWHISPIRDMPRLHDFLFLLCMNPDIEVLTGLDINQIIDRLFIPSAKKETAEVLLKTHKISFFPQIETNTEEQSAFRSITDYVNLFTHKRR